MGKHTPGPWHSSTTHEGKAFDIGAADGSNIALVYAEEGDVESAATGKANANRIAAAPVLLEALEQTTDAIERMAMRLDKEPGNQTTVSLWMMRVKENRAAIALARGGK